MLNGVVPWDEMIRRNLILRLRGENVSSNPFKRHGDPHGCEYREAANCLGVIMHCRLEPHGPEVSHVMEVSGRYVLANEGDARHG